MSFHYNFDKHDLLIYKNLPYRWLDKTEQGFRFISDDGHERVITIRHEEMQALIDSPDVRVKRAYFGRSQAAVRQNSSIDFLADLSPKKRFNALSDCEMARFGQVLIRNGEMSLSDASMEAAKPALAGHMANWAERQHLEEKARDRTRNAQTAAKDKARKRRDSRQTVVQFQTPSVKTWRKLIKNGIRSSFDYRAFGASKRVKGSKAQSRLTMESLVIMQEEVAKYATNRRISKMLIFTQN